DRARLQRLQHERLGEQLHGADDREDHHHRDDGLDHRQLDAEADPPATGAVEHRRLVDLARNRPQGGVEDHDVVSPERPDGDVADREEHDLGRQKVEPLPAGGGGHVAERAEGRAVQEAPHQRGDDAGDRVGHEVEGAVEAAAPDRSAVDDDSQQQREPDRERGEDQPVEEHPPEALPELGVSDGPDVVVPPHEHRAADQPILEQRVDQRDQQRPEREDEHRDEEWSDEDVGYPSSAPTPAGGGHSSVSHGGSGRLWWLPAAAMTRSEEHTAELQSRENLG